MRSKLDLALLLSEEVKTFKVVDKRGRLVYFQPNEPQKKVLRYIIKSWEEGKQAKIIIIKGRQFGISTLAGLIADSLVATIPNYEIYMMAHNRALATDLFNKKIRATWQKTDPRFRSKYKIRRDNTRQMTLEFGGGESTITVGMSGRGGTYQMVHISEPGMMSMDAALWEEMKSGTLQAAEFADLVILESTADGGLGPFYEYVQANKEFVLFLSWLDMPDYRATPDNSNFRERYRQIAEDFKLCPDPEKEYGLTEDQFFWYYQKAKDLREEVKSQYPLSLEEAFVSAALNFFRVRIIQDSLSRIRELREKGEYFYQIKHGFKIFKMPKKGRLYALAIDPSTGEADDNTAIQILDVETGEQVAVAKGKYDEEMTAVMAVNIGRFYNTAYIGVEVNNMGRAVLKFIMDKYNYPEERLYKMWVTDSTNPTGPKVPSFGWKTTGSSRPVLLTDFRAFFEENPWIVNDEETLQECLYFVNNKGKYEAQQGKRDDLVLSIMIAYQVLIYSREQTF